MKTQLSWRKQQVDEVLGSLLCTIYRTSNLKQFGESNMVYDGKRAEEMKSLNGLIEDRQRMLSCVLRATVKACFPLKHLELYWPDFHCCSLAQVREKGADIGDFLYHDHEISEREGME